MYVIHLLLPQHDNNHERFDDGRFQAVRKELTEKFGGVTAFIRSPAVGLWKESENSVGRDDVVMFEVLSPQLDKGWWAGYRRKLERIFRQEELLVWAVEATKL